MDQGAVGAPDCGAARAATLQEYEANAASQRAKTERLKALRLAGDAEVAKRTRVKQAEKLPKRVSPEDE